MSTSALYSLRTDGQSNAVGGYRITKFVDGEVESSYLVHQDSCECPAGHRHTCRHRQMLPQMLAHGICNTHFFFAFDTGGQIVDFNGTPKRLLDELTAAGALSVTKREVIDRDSRPQEETAKDTLIASPNITAAEVDERIRNMRGIDSSAVFEPIVDRVYKLVTKPAEAKPWRRL